MSTRLPAASAATAGPSASLQRIVPRRDHADHAQRLRQQAVAARQEMHLRGHAARAHPATQVAQGMADAGAHHEQFSQPAFVRAAAAEVGIDGRDEARLAPMRQLQQAAQAIDAHLPGGHRLAVECRALAGQHAGQRCTGEGACISMAASRRRPGTVSWMGFARASCLRIVIMHGPIIESRCMRHKARPGQPL